MAGELVVDRNRMAPEEALLDRAGAGLERLRLGPLFAHALRFRTHGAQRRFDLGRVDAGGLGIARERGVEGRLGERRTDGKFLHWNLPGSAQHSASRRPAKGARGRRA